MAKSLAMTYHNLSVMLDAGVPLLRSLNTVASGSEPRVRKALLALADGVSQGNPLAESMSHNRKLFNPVDVLLIQAAETSGSLPELIGLLSKWHESSQRMVKKLWSGMLLPILILTLAAFIAPIPAFVAGGWRIGTYLLTVLRILLLFWIPAGIIILIVCKTPKTGSLRRLLDQIVLRIPLLGHVMYRLAISRYCWIFHMLCKAGVPVVDCVGMAVSATGNAVVGDMFRPAIVSVKAGESICQGFSRHLPRELVEVWKIGEETGTLDNVTKRLAENNAEAAEFWLNEFARWFPRFVYFLVCLLMIYYVFINFGRIMTVY
jgi:type II secretory pathway component PulF